MNPLTVFMGFGSGVLVGVSGIGGAALLTPTLILEGVLPVVAVGSDLLCSLPTQIFAATLHAANRNVDWALLLRLCVGAFPGALAGVVLLGLFDRCFGPGTTNDVLRACLGVVLLVSAAIFALLPSLPHVPLSFTKGAAAVIAIGTVVGIVVALTSVGSGSLGLPLLALVAPQREIRIVIGTNAAFSGFVTALATTGHLELGSVDISLTAVLLAGSLPGVYLGNRLSVMLPQAWLRAGIASVLLLAGTRTLFSLS